MILEKVANKASNLNLVYFESNLNNTNFGKRNDLLYAQGLEEHFGVEQLNNSTILGSNYDALDLRYATEESFNPANLKI